MPRAFRHHRHGGALGRQTGIQLVLDPLKKSGHVADGAVAQERHGAVGDMALGFHLRPPHATVAQADAIDVQRFGDDDVIDSRPREIAFFCQIGDATEAPRFLVRGARNFDRAREVASELLQKRLGRDDRRGDAALHVAGPTAIDPCRP